EAGGLVIPPTGRVTVVPRRPPPQGGRSEADRLPNQTARGSAAGAARLGAAASLSSVSAAIHPPIRTIGIPGPGCAAPPARYSPATSADRFAGLNAPSHLPWLASP